MSRSNLLKEAFKKRILVTDGAMGTAIQSYGLTADDFGGDEFEGCNEYLNLVNPGIIREIHESHLKVGADILKTNTFGSTALVLSEYQLHEQAYAITRAGAQIARELADAYSTPEQPRFVAGSMGPTTKAISVTGGVTFDELVENFREQARALIDGGVDYLLIETSQDTRNVKAALIGIRQLFDEIGFEVPVAVSGTIEPMGTMLGGQTAEAFVTSLSHWDLLYIGLNCATGPDFMTDHIRAMSELAKVPIGCVPNAGLPDEDGNYIETPETMAKVLRRFCQEGWVNLIGGCCGTRPDHIAAFVELAKDYKPRVPASHQRSFVSGIENLEITDENRPIIVGERTNVIGSRLFKQLIIEGKFEEASEIARRQVRGGAQIIDVCLANPDRDELQDMENFLAHVIHKVKVPLMIDSTDAKVIERALTYCQGKAIINSINLEDGEERFEQVVPLAKRFGAALVVGTIDDDPQQGMAITRERKLAIAQRSYDLLVNKYGFPPEDIYFDPLVFPCATGDETYLGSARETIEGIRLIKQAMPLTKTILGISNVSFGLPPAGREVLNSVFLYECVQAGLDLAIVNAEKIERYASIPDEEKRLAYDVLFNTSEETIAAFAAHFRDATSRIKKDQTKLSLDERLANYIIEGSKDGLFEDLDKKLAEGATPLDIINGPLMAGMDEVGRLFGNNELIVAEVLQSAEAMKAAVAYLEPLMETGTTASKGSIVLATVKGDVHDIGKNLVDIIFSNNGYKVINLGIKVPPNELIQAVKEHKPDMIGLSGLLVKSAQQMVVTAEELRQAGIDLPILVGGAALTNNFTRLRIAPKYDGLVAYARDAMSGLELANQIMDPEKRRQLIADLEAQTTALQQQRGKIRRQKTEAEAERSPTIPVLANPPAPPDLKRHVLRNIDLDTVWRYINPQMLYVRHLGLKGRFEQLLEQGDEKAVMLKEIVDELKAMCRQGAMHVHAVWQFFEAASEGNKIYIFQAGTDEVIETFEFPRQAVEDGGLCLADYVNPAHPGPWGDAPPRDNIAFFAVTAGDGIRELYQKYREEGEYLKSHAIQALAIETAEGAAEWLHQKMRAWWGIADDPTITMLDLFKANYIGRRYSFGYPACPDLAMQKQLFRLIQPEEIGIELTEEFMMEPEASVSAMVVHHPAAKYFAIKNSGDGEEQTG